MKRKPHKFRVGQRAMYRFNCMEFPVTIVGQPSIASFLAYEVELSDGELGYVTERELRPLTRREKEGK
jgi:hypothetical protein